MGLFVREWQFDVSVAMAGLDAEERERKRHQRELDRKGRRSGYRLGR